MHHIRLESTLEHALALNDPFSMTGIGDRTITMARSVWPKTKLWMTPRYLYEEYIDIYVPVPFYEF